MRERPARPATRAELPRRRWHVLALTLLTLLMALPGLSRMPVIDRDEARFAQSSVQMVESGDWVEIRLGDEARNKKPVGAYWAQAAMLTIAGDGDVPGDRLWAQRLPSVLAAVLAVLLTYLAGIPILGRRGAALAGAMLATSVLVVFEAHIAKTDALLLASTTALFAALARLRAGRIKYSVWLFWIGLAASLLIKGPVGVTLVLLCFGGLLAWERTLGWARPLLRPLPILAFLAISVPWFVAIGFATDGQFYADSLGRDLGGKIAAAAENHDGPPGYNLLMVWLMLWPASLFLIPGVWFAAQASRIGDKGRSADSGPARGMRLVLAWVVPFWIILELIPTKLPHYPLPLYPALCLAMAGAVMAIWGGGVFARTRWVSAAIFLVSTAALLGIILFVQAQYGAEAYLWSAVMVALVSGTAALVAVIGAMTARMRLAVVAAGIAAVPLSVVTYALLLPVASPLQVTQRLARAPAPIVSPHYAEDSLRYYAGRTDIRLGDDTRWEDFTTWEGGTLVIDDRRAPGALASVFERARVQDACLKEHDRIRGFNYNSGDDVELVLLRQTACSDPAAPSE